MISSLAPQYQRDGQFVGVDEPLPYWFRQVGPRVVSNYSIWAGLANVPVFLVARGLGLPLYEQRLGLTLVTTALLAALGLFPASISHAIGSETQRPIAVVVVGGTLSAALLTLIVLPVSYYWSLEFAAMLARRRARRAPVPA